MAEERTAEPKPKGVARKVPSVPKGGPAAVAAASRPPPVGAKPTPAKTAQAVGPRDIGIEVPKPAKACGDVHCPFHGTLPVRGQTFEGRVVSTRMQRTAVVERDYLRYIRKYERYEKRTKRFHVHSPPCLELKEGDWAVLMECRPIAKTVAFVAIQNKGVAA